MPSWNSWWGRERRVEECEVEVGWGDVNGKGRKMNKNFLSDEFTAKPFRVPSSFKQDLSNSAFLTLTLLLFSASVPFYMCAHTPSPFTPFYFLSSFRALPFDAENIFFAYPPKHFFCALFAFHILMPLLNIIKFNSPWCWNYSRNKQSFRSIRNCSSSKLKLKLKHSHETFLRIFHRQIHDEHF